MSTFEPKPQEQLLLAINTENLDEIEKLLKSPENKQLPESFMAAAERTHNDDIVGCVLDQILNNGLDIDHDFPTQLHWALAKGFRMTAANLASVITEADLLATDSSGMTVLELAEELKCFDVVDLLEDRD